MLDFVLEFYAFLRERRKFWLWPVCTLVLLIGAFLVFIQGSPVAPFIYALF